MTRSPAGEPVAGDDFCVPPQHEEPVTGSPAGLHSQKPQRAVNQAQAKTPAVSCMRADTSPRWCRVSPNVISSCVSFLK